MRRCRPECPIKKHRTNEWRILARLTSLAAAILFSAFALAWLGHRLEIISAAGSVLLTAASLLISFYVYLRHHFRWPPVPHGSLTASDVHSAIYFVPTCLLSWTSLLAAALNGWELWIAAVSATSIHLMYTFGIFLRLPCVASEVAQSLDPSAQLSQEQRQLIRERLDHDLYCGSKKEGYREKRRRADAHRYRQRAAGRRRAGQSPLVQTARAWAQQRALEYSDTSMWLSASLASAGLFTALGSIAAPAPMAALFMISPFILIPAATTIRKRIRSQSS